MSGRLEPSSKWARRAWKGHHWWWDIYFWVRPGNHVPELSVVESPRPKKARQSNPKVKVMLITFLNVKGIINCEFLPQDQTINQQVYIEILWRLLCLVHRKRQELWQGKLWLLHHNNAPVHNACYHSSWPRISLCWNNLPVHLTLLHVTFFFSPSSKESSRRPVLKMWRLSRGL